MSEAPQSVPNRPQGDRSRRPSVAILFLALSGVLAIVGGGVAIGADLTRKPTAAQIEAAGQKEIASRWRALTAGEIFPARTDETGSNSSFYPAWTALRVGIAPRASCAKGFDPPLADVLVKHGCRTVLRATYVDGSGTLLTTLGVAVMPDAHRAGDAEEDFYATLGLREEAGRYGVRAVSFPGTVAESFTDPLRQDFAYQFNGTPYLFFRSSGWIVDRATPVKTVVQDTFEFARFALEKVELSFIGTSEPCKRRGVRC